MRTSLILCVLVVAGAVVACGGRTVARAPITGVEPFELGMTRAEIEERAPMERFVGDMDYGGYTTSYILSPNIEELEPYIVSIEFCYSKPENEVLAIRTHMARRFDVQRDSHHATVDLYKTCRESLISKHGPPTAFEVRLSPLGDPLSYEEGGGRIMWEDGSGNRLILHRAASIYSGGGYFRLDWLSSEAIRTQIYKPR